MRSPCTSSLHARCDGRRTSTMIVEVTFIMAKAKQKVTVPAMAGWTLLEAAQHHGLLEHCTHADPAWDYATFGEGPASAEDHVVVERKYFDIIQETSPLGYMEKNVLDSEVFEDLTPTSRLATCIKLTKAQHVSHRADTNPDTTNYCENFPMFRMRPEAYDSTGGTFASRTARLAARRCVAGDRYEPGFDTVPTLNGASDGMT